MIQNNINKYFINKIMEEDKEKEEDKDIIPIKISLIGDSGVGKTCIIKRYTTNKFSEEVIATTGVNYSKKNVIYNDKKVRLDIWDTAGQEQYRSLGKHFYHDSFIIILVYNITKRETFDNLKNIWLEDLLLYGEDCKVLAIAGNKADLFEQEAVAEKEAREFANLNNALFMYVSAKSGNNICTLFDACLKQYFEPKFLKQVKEIQRRNNDLIQIDSHKHHKSKKDKNQKHCC